MAPREPSPPRSQGPEHGYSSPKTIVGASSLATTQPTPLRTSTTRPGSRSPSATTTCPIPSSRDTPVGFASDIALPAQSGPIDLLLVGTKGSFQIYVDGEQIGGTILSSLRWRKGQELIFPLRKAGGSDRNSVEVAIRSHLYSSEFSEVHFAQADVGTPEAIEIAARAHEGTRVGDLVFPITILVATVIAALLLLALFYQQPAHREYLWLGLTLLFFALTTGLPQIDIYGGVPYSWNAFLGDPCTYFFIATQLEFIYSFIGRRPGRFHSHLPGRSHPDSFSLQPSPLAGSVSQRYARMGRERVLLCLPWSSLWWSCFAHIALAAGRPDCSSSPPSSPMRQGSCSGLSSSFKRAIPTLLFHRSTLAWFASASK